MSFIRTFKTLSILAAMMSVSACGTVISGQTQEITLVTPGTDNARCILNNGVQYRVETGDTIDIMRSRDDLVADCYAPGNRHKKIVIESMLNGWSAVNVTNGVVPGVTYDHLAKGLYAYPPTLTVDFTAMAANGFQTPSYQDKETLNPYNQAIEDYTPTTPRISNDSVYLSRDVARTGMDSSGSNPYSRNVSPGTGTAAGGDYATGGLSGPDAAWSPSRAGASLPKGGNAESMTRAMNPSVFTN